MREFVPTYLYIKLHTITGKCYFGKTIKDPLKYLGSGIRWRRHIRQHGKDKVETLWYKLFDTREELIRISLLFSEQQDIVKSERWLNLVPENGFDGNGRYGKGRIFSAEHRANLSAAQKERSDETCAKISASKMGKKFTPEQNAAKSARQTGKKHKPHKKHNYPNKLKENRNAKNC